MRNTCWFNRGIGLCMNKIGIVGIAIDGGGGYGGLVRRLGSNGMREEAHGYD